MHMLANGNTTVIAIATEMTKFKIGEGFPYCLNVTRVPEEFQRGTRRPQTLHGRQMQPPALL